MWFAESLWVVIQVTDAVGMVTSSANTISSPADADIMADDNLQQCMPPSTEVSSSRSSSSRSRSSSTRCFIKKETLIFDYNSHISWSIFIILALVERGINAPQHHVYLWYGTLCSSSSSCCGCCCCCCCCCCCEVITAYCLDDLKSHLQANWLYTGISSGPNTQ